MSGRTDEMRMAVLGRTIALILDHVTLGEALDTVAARGRLRLTYSRAQVPLERVVSLVADPITVGDALTVLLRNTGVEAFVSAKGWVTLQRADLGRGDASGRRGGQQSGGTIAGRLTDVTTGRPLPAAAVIVDETGYRATTKADGQYAISGVPSGTYTITARILGHTPQSKPIVVHADSVTRIDFALADAATALEEVVTTAVGDQRKIELGNAIATINADSIVRTAPITQLTDVLSGRAPGVEVLEQQGQVGAGPRIRIRGQSSFSLSNDPIIYLDGVRVDNAAGTTLNAATASVFPGGWPTPSRLNDIDPSDIASIDVLKGPSAATEYGTDAANGVIVIKTKHGQVGSPRWEFRGEQGVSTMPAHFAVPWYSWGHTTDVTHTPVNCPRTFGGGGPTVANGGCVIDSVTTYQPLDHAATTLFGTGTSSRVGAQVSGGAQQLQYFLAGAYDDATGVLQLPPFEQAQLLAQGRPLPNYELRPNAMDQSSVRGKVTGAMGSTADFGFSGAYVSNHQRSAQDLLPLTGAVVGLGYRDSTYGGYGGGGFYAPINLFGLTGAEGVHRFSGSTNGTWRPVAWLNTRATVGIDLGNRTDEGYQAPGPDPDFLTFFPGNTGTGYHAIGSISTTLYTVDVGATATAPLSADLSSKTSAGFQYNVRNETGALTRAYGLTANGSLNGAIVYASSQVDSEARTVGSYVEESVGWRDRLFVTGAVRVDAGSGFGSQVNSAVYPKASLSWAAVQSPHYHLRLRAAYGESGVQPPSGATLSLYAPATVALNGGSGTADTAATTGNARLKPERSAEIETGVDAGMLSDRLTFELTYYNKRSHNTIVSTILPGSLGSTIEFENLGAVRNYGVEGSITTQVLTTRLIGWDVTVGGSINQNRLVSLAPGVPPLTAPFYPLLVQYQQVVGYPIFGLWAQQLHYADANHDGIIEPTEVSASSSASFMGSSIPTREVTLSSGIELLRRRVRINGQVDYRGGFHIQNALKGAIEINPIAAAFNNPHASLADQARAVEQSATFGPLTSPYFEDGSFVRLRELSISYVLPDGLARALRLRAGSITFLGRNLALWTRYSGADPETTSNVLTDGAPPDGAYDVGAVPQVRSWALRLNLGL